MVTEVVWQARLLRQGKPQADEREPELLAQLHDAPLGQPVGLLPEAPRPERVRRRECQQTLAVSRYRWPKRGCQARQRPRCDHGSTHARPHQAPVARALNPKLLQRCFSRAWLSLTSTACTTAAMRCIEPKSTAMTVRSTRSFEAMNSGVSSLICPMSRTRREEALRGAKSVRWRHAVVFREEEKRRGGGHESRKVRVSVAR